MQLWKKITLAIRELLFGVIPYDETVASFTVHIDDIPIPIAPAPIDDEELLVLPFENIESFIEYAKLHRAEVYGYVLKRVARGVRENLQAINLYKLQGTKKLVQVSSKNYTPQLEVLKKYYVSTEEYEHAQECQTLIDLWHINQLTQ